MSRVEIQTELGSIKLHMRADAAPRTCKYIKKCVKAGLYDGCNFYRSDFVIQCGLHGSGKENPYGDLPVNECNMNKRLSNKTGTCSIAHFDVPDNGNTEFFINIQNNMHLDNVYGGYCVFAFVEERDQESWKTIHAIADAIANQGRSTVQMQKVSMAGVPKTLHGIGTF